MPLSALLFDLDGTLLNTNELHARAWQRALDSQGFRVPDGRIVMEIGKAGEQVVPSLVGEEAEAHHGDALRDAQGEAYRKIVRGGDMDIFPGVEALLEACRERGLQTALVTGSGADDLDVVLDVVEESAGVDLAASFDVLVTGDDAEAGKPAPDPVQAAAGKLGTTPGQCALVGDTPYDAQAARRAGAVGLGVLTGVHAPEAMHRVGMRACYDDPAALRAALDDALQQASPGKKAFTEAHLSNLVQEALDEAWAGLSEGEIPIGSVVASGAGRIVGRGHNRARATGSRVAHAEMLALADAGGAEDGGVLATTVEPCAMCLGAAMAAGIDTVIYALPAPSNGGTERVTPPADGFFPRVIGGVRAEGSRALLRRWLDRHPDDDFARELMDGA
jgi:HAD superfamily hydrolase (TIGR01509 family)